MSIRIVLPEGDGTKAGAGTKVYTSSGEEITNITKIHIPEFGAHDLIVAELTIAVGGIENLEGLEGIAVVREDKPDGLWSRISKFITFHADAVNGH